MLSTSGRRCTAALKVVNARKVDREPYQRFVIEIETLRELVDFPGVPTTPLGV